MFEQIGQFYLRHICRYEQRHADWRGNQAYGQVEAAQYAKVNRVDAVFHSDGKQNRGHHQQRRALIQHAAQKNVGIAIENLWDFNIAPKRRYTTTAEELVDLVDSLHKDFENVGICWDVEHADIMQQAQGPALRMIGSRLKATHISDNVGVKYDHVLPFDGYTDWNALMKLLKEIKYGGDFTYEIHRYTSQLPDAMVPAALRYSVEMGNYLLSLAE